MREKGDGTVFTCKSNVVVQTTYVITTCEWDEDTCVTLWWDGEGKKRK